MSRVTGWEPLPRAAGDLERAVPAPILTAEQVAIARRRDLRRVLLTFASILVLVPACAWDVERRTHETAGAVVGALVGCAAAAAGLFSGLARRWNGSDLRWAYQPADALPADKRRVLRTSLRTGMLPHDPEVSAVLPGVLARLERWRYIWVAYLCSCVGTLSTVIDNRHGLRYVFLPIDVLLVGCVAFQLWTNRQASNLRRLLAEGNTE